ncbi:uncharacterized protein LOC128556118 [Mercenaria mercenaria]|uniref:uncharacterized protein LOC128556118 n=1 Tax=Mercenaria mercenaria TaxID=6596 RepID=UPI00234E9EA7|nr:uncharacterized protein LOC128556118 [Mercenaria mercenaria]
MIKLENEHYIRFILLLIKGGTEVLRKTFTKGLKKQNVSLNEFLQTNKADICNSKQISKLQRDILYPPPPHYSDISKWDISLLSYIALNFLSNELSGTETLALKKIRDMRNDIHGHSNDAAIETRKFTCIWSELSLVITTLSYTMSDEERQGLIDLISTLSSDQLDIYKAIEELKLLERRDEFFECIQTSLENLQRSQSELASAVDSCHKDVIQMNETMCQGLLDIRKQLFDMSKSMENRGENTKIVNTMFGRVRVSADEQSIVNTAENVLLSASVESVRKSESSGTLSAVKEKVDTFVEDVEGLSVKVDSVDEGSIVFTFTCSSLGALIDLIDYFQSPLIERRLDGIAIALESVICHKVRLTASIPVEPLQEIVKKLQAADPQRTLKFSMTCTGVEGLQHAWEVFEEEAASNSINNLSKALTDAVGKPVRVETAIDMEQMKKAIQLTKAQLGGSRDIDSGENLAERFEEVHVGYGGVDDTKKHIEERIKDSPGKCFEGEDSTVVKETGADQRQGGISKRPKTEKKNIVLERESKRQKIEEDSETKPNDDERTGKDLEEGQQTMVFGLAKPEVMNEGKSQLNISTSSSVNLFSLDSEKRNDNIGEQTHGGNSEDVTNVQRKKMTKIEIEKMDVSTAEHTQAQYGDYGHDVDAAFHMQTRSQTKKALAERGTDSGNAKASAIQFVKI